MSTRVAFDLLSVTEYAAQAGITRQAVLQRINRGTLSAVKVGKTYVIVQPVP